MVPMDAKEVMKIIQLYSEIFDMQQIPIDSVIQNPSIFFITVIEALIKSNDSNLLIALYLLKHLYLESNLNINWREDAELLVVRFFLRFDRLDHRFEYKQAERTTSQCRVASLCFNAP